MLAPIESLAMIPDGISMTDAAPLLCAGVTTFNALRNSGARAGDLVAIQGIGGLGHLGVLFARALGHRAVAISRGADKGTLAARLGAAEFIDAGKSDPAQELTKMGGARVILATAPHAKSIAALVPGLGRDGRLIVVAAALEPIPISAIDLIMGRRSILGWPSGHAQDSTDTLNFAVENNIRPMTQTFPLDQAHTAYTKMLRGEVRFRSVLEITPAT
jgi:D-arabinose 1-dehydrogenase-like Zn-dependent alcohol dehydrogenase